MGKRKLFKLIWAVSCSECEADLPIGSYAYYYPGSGRYYGIDCHSKKTKITRKDKKVVEIRRLKAGNEVMRNRLLVYAEQNKKLKIENRNYKFKKTFGDRAEACQECSGDGYQDSKSCLKCDGAGFLI